MTLRRRLLTYLLLCAPLVWALAFAISFDRARDEVDELFDTELIRLARQVQALLPAEGSASDVSFGPLPRLPVQGDAGGAGDAGSLATAVWDRSGRRVVDHDAAELRYRPGRTGFVDEVLDGKAWRVYYLSSASGAWLAAAGQRAHERSELVYDITLSQLVPWIVMLPVLMAAMALAVRRALAPVQDLAGHLGQRAAEDLSPMAPEGQPGELLPVVAAMNGLFRRVADALAHERRFTADAAHEIRTPLAALRAQWDVVRRSAPGPQRALAEERLSAGLDRMDRAVTQLLLLSRVDSVRPGTEGAARQDEIDWHAVVEEVVADCLPLAERRQVEISCEWPSDDRRAFPLLGNQALLALMLRNLLDNAVRYATPRSAVVLRFCETTLTVTNDAPPVSRERLARLGERFYRIEGHDEPGSGLGISIARRIALLHGLEIAFSAPAAGPGEFRATVRFAGAATLAPLPAQAPPGRRLTPLEAAP